MLAQARDLFLDDEFGRPVESIMRCEDFKSNFARRLSNRYISRSSVSGSRQNTVLKLRPTDKQEILNNVSTLFIRKLFFNSINFKIIAFKSVTVVFGRNIFVYMSGTVTIKAKKYIIWYYYFYNA